jgi:protein-S-isoprenylcysteine O-methyltransferase Ste14
MDTTVVVDKGLYAIVRHPQYVGYILLFFGFVLLSQSGVTLVLAALGIFAMVTLAMQEERDCLEHFGGSYAAYRQRVPPFNFLLGVIQYLRRTFDGKEGLSSNGPSSP